MLHEKSGRAGGSDCGDFEIEVAVMGRKSIQDAVIGWHADDVALQMEDKFTAALIRATKPVGATCDCPPGCVGLPCCH